jgi:hypothetical protein
VHKRQQVLATPEAWYAGNLQGRSFRETGAKGALLVTIPAEGPTDVVFRPLAPVRFEVIELTDLLDVVNLSDLLTRARARFERIAAAPDVLPDQEWLLRVVLSGPCPLAVVLRSPDAEGEVAAEIASWPGVLDAELRASRVTPPVELSEHRGQPHVLGLALELLQDLRTDDDLLDHVAPEVLAGFKGDLDDDAQVFAYVRGMLVGLEGDVAEALLKEARP